MTEFLSPSLRKYRELIVAPAPEHLQKGTWIPLARWVAKNIPQETIMQVSVELWRELDPICQASGGTTEEKLADAIRDASDVTWYAMKEETISKFNLAIVPSLKPDERITA
jgi:hypothetical protein